MAEKTIYKVRFVNQGKIYEIYAREVSQGGIFGFIEVGKIIWGTKSDVIIDPTEQELKNEFNGVKRTYIPMHAVIRIDEVEKSGTGKVIPLPSAGGGQMTALPLYSPGAEPKESK